jgi:hypothetical protein
MTSTTNELIWIKQLLENLDIIIETPMKMHCDNQATRHIASNPVFHKRTKYIEIDCHFVREKIQSNEIKAPFVKSDNQLAEVFTKGLDPGLFHKNIDKLGMFDIYTPNLRGSVEK